MSNQNRNIKEKLETKISDLEQEIEEQKNLISEREKDTDKLQNDHRDALFKKVKL